jgi:hypothetical protein
MGQMVCRLCSAHVLGYCWDVLVFARFEVILTRYTIRLKNSPLGGRKWRILAPCKFDV